MKSAENLKARLGANMKESMGAARPAGVAGPLPDPAALHGGTARYQGAARVKDALAIELDRIVPDPDQPRKEFDPQGLAELAASLKSRGQLQPIRVRWDEALGKWVVIAGERRYRAARLAGLATLACIEARGPQSAEEILEDQLVENCLREDLKPVEQARAFQALIERRGWSYRQLAEHLNLAASSVARALALLELPDDLQRRVDAGAVPASTAYEVSRLDDDAARRDLFARVESGALTRDDVTAAVRRARPADRPPRAGGGRGAAPGPTSRVVRLPGARVTVELTRGSGAGAILDALGAALEKLRAESRSRAAGPAADPGEQAA